MVLRLATWNVDSLRRRLDRLARFAAEAEPDLIRLQGDRGDRRAVPARGRGSVFVSSSI
ncbi:MAG: hypothetical protein IIA72_11800 [Proteobacteria bacterium]|nr:hypothetical protein [Pseudomonadota bacterium]